MPLAQRLDALESEAYSHGASTALVQSVTRITAAAPEAAAAAADCCARTLSGRLQPWNIVRLRGQPSEASAAEALTQFPAGALLAGAQAAGLAPAGCLDRLGPALHLIVWAAAVMVAICAMAVNGEAGGLLGPGWRLAYVMVAGIILWGVLRAVGRSRGRRQMHRLAGAIRDCHDPAQVTAFAKAAAEHVVEAVGTPTAIVIEGLGRLDPLTLRIVEHMRKSRPAALVGVLHWIVLGCGAEDDALAQSVFGSAAPTDGAYFLVAS